jgi:hypothetical protein
MGMISDYRTPESHPENPRWAWGTHPCLLVELREKTVYENGFLDRCVSAIFEFSGNEFELGANKIEREREPIIFWI